MHRSGGSWSPSFYHGISRGTSANYRVRRVTNPEALGYEDRRRGSIEIAVTAYTATAAFAEFAETLKGPPRTISIDRDWIVNQAEAKERAR